jgi:hypothetical protein
VLIDPVDQTAIRADPQASVSCGQQGGDEGGRQRLTVLRAPWNKPDAIEPEKAGVGPYPDIPIFGLGNGACLTAEISVLRSPGGVTVLRDMPVRVQRKHWLWKDKHQEQAGDRKPGRVHAAAIDDTESS